MWIFSLECMDQDCLLCPTGFAANTAAIVAIGKVGSLLASGSKPLKHEKIAIFSDALNHASIVDGIRLSGANVYVYRHSDMTHLDLILNNY
ncbi:hypothetical protein TIFTF001_010251 [Ficus carica]|uniref:Aminotransferase class I/classII domain-containing protein n=1 Tax=Ficus carica TaxID=3494 RepID=A0AA87ZPS8_FICCA|nr:hypothetical protein TIFTF001_010251 [Ficus carica]